MFDELKKIAQNLLQFFTPARKSADAAVAKTEKAEAGAPMVAGRTTEQEHAVRPLSPLLNDNVDHKRYRVAQDAWKMFFEDDRVRTGTRINTELITQRGQDGKPFNVSVALDNKNEAQELQTEIDETFKRLGVYEDADALMRATFSEGSRYQRIIYELDGKGMPQRVIGWKPIPSARKDFMVVGPVSSEDPRINGGYLHYSLLDKRATNFFFRWEVCPFHWDYDLDTGYGIPLTSSGRTNFERLYQVERSVAQARKARGYNRLGFSIEAANMAEFEKVMAKMEEQRQNFGADDLYSDVYVKGDVKTLSEGSSTIFNIGDIKHHQAKLQDSLLVPKGLYPSGGENVNRAVLQVQHENWINGVIRDGELVLEAGLLPLIAAILLPLGRTLEFTPVIFNWPPKHLVDPQYVQALREARKTGDISRQTYLQLAFKTSREREDALIDQEMEFELEMQAKRRELEMKLLGNTAAPGDDIAVEDDDIEVETEENFPKVRRLALSR